mgnify:CR=1 FL=1
MDSQTTPLLWVLDQCQKFLWRSLVKYHRSLYRRRIPFHPRCEALQCVTEAACHCHRYTKPKTRVSLGVGTIVNAYHIVSPFITSSKRLLIPSIPSLIRILRVYFGLLLRVPPTLWYRSSVCFLCRVHFFLCLLKR